MPAQNVEEVKIDLIEYFSEKISSSKFFDDYAAIGSYLSNPNKYGDALRKLDSDMEQLYVNRISKEYPSYDIPNAYKEKELTQDFKYLQKSYLSNQLIKERETWNTDLVKAEKAIKQFSKLLTATLANNEQKHGFSIEEENPATDIIVGLPSRFNELLRQKKPFKDVGAGHAHGEYSHRIQWYLITQMEGLQFTPAEIYKKLPGWSTRHTEYTTPRNFYMWEFLVDRDGVPTNAAVIPFKTTEQQDFRAPSNVNRWLCDMAQSQTYSWLHACLKKRWDKRSAENLTLYVAKKLLKKSVNNMRDLNDDEFNKIEQCILGEAIIKRT